MPHMKSTDSLIMAERIQVSMFLCLALKNVFRSINFNRYTSYCSRVKEVT